NWLKWEIVALWAVESNLHPDFSKPRQLLEKEIAGEQNPYILGSALRVGLLTADELNQLKNYPAQRRLLLTALPPSLNRQGFINLEQQDWVIRAAVLRNDLSPEERDEVARRLHAVLENLTEETFDGLKTALRVTQLLDVIDRPIDREQFRTKLH